jgi:hypothetical protein
VYAIQLLNLIRVLTAAKLTVTWGAVLIKKQLEQCHVSCKITYPKNAVKHLIAIVSAFKNTLNQLLEKYNTHTGENLKAWCEGTSYQETQCQNL